MANTKSKAASLDPFEPPAIERRIFVIRNRQVMLDEDLAELYGVETRVLVQQVRRNEKRFPEDFMFQLSAEEFANLKSQFVMSSHGHGGRRKRPLVFTEQGIAMLSGVLRSDRAITVNIEIMRTFVELRRVASNFAEIQKQLKKFERETTEPLDGHDKELKAIFAALHQLINPPVPAKKPVGFRVRDEDD